MPPNWRDEYLSSLRDSELNNPVNMELVQTCSHMADRISALEAEKSALEAHISSSKSKPSARTGKPTATTTTTAAAAAAAADDDPGVAQLRLDLAESLRSKGVAEARLRAAEEELDKLRARTTGDSRALRDLRSERDALLTRIKDREHELREKKKLLDNVQDEMIGLELHLSMVEKDKDKVKKENKDLVDRWMKRMAKEADAMNLANEPAAAAGNNT